MWRIMKWGHKIQGRRQSVKIDREPRQYELVGSGFQAEGKYRENKGTRFKI